MTPKLVRWIPLTNGTAFMGMGPNTGLNEGKEYPYILYAEHEAALKERDEYWEECLRKADSRIDELVSELEDHRP